MNKCICITKTNNENVSRPIRLLAQQWCFPCISDVLKNTDYNGLKINMKNSYTLEMWNFLEILWAYLCCYETFISMIIVLGYHANQNTFLSPILIITSTKKIRWWNIDSLSRRRINRISVLSSHGMQMRRPITEWCKLWIALCRSLMT